MAKKYTKEQFWKLYQKLPQELKDALFAEETSDNIYEICKRNGISEKLEQIVEYVGNVLLGILPPDEFQETLEKELELEKGLAKKVNHEIYRFVFYPVKASLEELYKIEISPLPIKPIEMEIVSALKKEKKSARPPKDVYRELVE